LPLNVWTHLAVTYDGATLKLFVNGALVASKAQTGSIEVSSGALRMGGNSIWQEWFKGAIDEVRVYNRALSQAQIQTDMTTPIGGAPAPPPPPPPAALLGDQQVEVDANPESPGTAEAFPSAASASGTLHSLSLYLDASSTAVSLVAGVYTNNGGHPGTLLAQGSLAGPTAGAWNTIPISAVSVNAGTTYWLALLGPSGTLVFRDRCCTVTGSSPTETSAQTTLSTLPATWSTGGVYDDGPMSFYGSG